MTIDARITAITYTGDHRSALFCPLPIPSPSRRTLAAIRFMHGRWTRSRGAGHDNLRASVGSTEASRKHLAVKCKSVCLSPSNRERLLLPNGFGVVGPMRASVDSTSPNSQTGARESTSSRYSGSVWCLRRESRQEPMLGRGRWFRGAQSGEDHARNDVAEHGQSQRELRTCDWFAKAAVDRIEHTNFFLG